jgi:hypothetical protein
LDVRRLIGGRSERAGGLAHYVRRELGVLDIFFEYSLKVPQIHSNMLEYTRIYSNILEYFLIGCARRSTGQGGRASGPGGRASGHIDNPSK